jgi:hypothetical protein
MIEPTSEIDDEKALPAGFTAAGIVVLCLVGALSGLIEVLLVPLYIGSHIFPITVLIAIVLNIALPNLAHNLSESRAAIVAPLLCWLVVEVGLASVSPGNASVLVPGYGDGQYVGLALFFVGALAGFVGVIRVRTAQRIRTTSGPTAAGRR